MSIKPLPGFRSLDTHHCITGSLRHIYTYHEHPLSEELLLGIGSGVGFIYWHQKGTLPFIGGRINFERPSEEGLEKTAGRRTGVQVDSYTTSSARKAEKTLLEQLDAGRPVMIYCDMGFLPYFDFGEEEYHFGGHSVVVCGYEAAVQQALVADRDGTYAVSMEDLTKARGSTYKPFPPHNKWYTFDFSQKRLPTAEEVQQAIRDQVERALHPPISNFGVKGIRRTAKEVTKWPQKMGEKELRATMFNAHIFIDATGGTGGGIFRYMFSRFLHEAAEMTGMAGLKAIAEQFQQIGDRWQDVAAIFQRGWEAEDPAAALAEVTTPIREIADMEETAWTELGAVVG